MKFANDAPDDDPAHRLWRCEVLLYTDRLSECREELAAPFPPELDVRARLIIGECDLWESLTESAEAIARECAQMARGRWPVEEARAVTLIARAAQRREEFGEALKRAVPARELIDALGLEHLGGVLAVLEGFARTKVRCDGKAARKLESAVATFARLKDRRWESIARAGLGVWFDEHGQSMEAEREQLEALRLADRSGFVRESITARHNVAQFYLATGRVGEAARTLRNLLDEERTGQYGAVEARGLVSLAYALVLEGQIGEAKRAAGEAARLASALGVPFVATDAENLGAWLAARDGDPDAVEVLRGFLGRRERAEDQRFRALLYLADALGAVSPIEADALWREASTSPEASSGSTFAGLVEYIAKRLRAYPVRIVDGDLVISTKHGTTPKLRPTFEAVERYLVSGAMRQASGCQMDAARLLGESKGNLNKRIKKFWPERIGTRAEWPG